MPSKKRGKRGRADEHLPNTEPNAKRQKQDLQSSNSLEKGLRPAQSIESEVGKHQVVPQIQQQQQVEANSQSDYTVDDTYNEYENEQQPTKDHIQYHIAKQESSGGETYDPNPLEFNVLQAEEWDMLSPDVRLHALNWSLIRAIGVLECMHINLMESQNSNHSDSSDRESPLPDGALPVF